MRVWCVFVLQEIDLVARGHFAAVCCLLQRARTLARASDRRFPCTHRQNTS